MKTQPQLDRYDPPNKNIGTMAPKPPDAPTRPTSRRYGCNGCLKLIVLLAISFALWLYLRH